MVGVHALFAAPYTDFVPGSSKNDVSDLLSVAQFTIPSPTILFLKPAHLQTLTSSIVSKAKKSWMYSFANRHKLAGVKEGFSTRDSLWDRLVFDSARATVLNDGADTIRSVIISGGELH